MNTCLAILAHAGAAKTCSQFLPKWRSLGLPLYAFVPEGHWVSGFETVYQQGRSAHKGYFVFDRFLRCCETLLGTLHDQFIIAEYDTVNLRPEMPTSKPFTLTSPGIFTPPILGDARNVQMCMLSPWTMSRKWAEEFIMIARSELALDPDFPTGGGLLDRWIGETVRTHNLPVANCDNAFGYPWHIGMEERIKRMNFCWIHGLIDKSEFGELWTE